MIVWRLFRFYCGVGLVAFAAMNAYNVYIDGSSWEHVARFDLYFTFAGTACSVGLLTLISYRRLGLARRYFSLAEADPGERRQIFLRLLRFPAELMVGCLICAFLFSASYHLLELFILRLRPLSGIIYRHIVSEQLSALTVAIILYSGARSAIRPFIQQLRIAELGTIRPFGMTLPQTAVFSILLAYGLLVEIWFVYNMHLLGRPLASASLLLLEGVLLLFGGTIYGLYLTSFQQELALVSEGMGRLRRGTAGEARPELIAVVARNEIGCLAAAYNRLRLRVEREYEELRRDRDLAVRLQTALLPERSLKLGDWRMTASVGVPGSAAGIHGGWYDAVPLGNGRWAVIAGRADGSGPAAALRMSANLVLFRSEAGRGESPEEMLRAIRGSFPDRGSGKADHALLVILDTGSAFARYASLGDALLLMGTGAGASFRPAPASPFVPDKGESLVLAISASGREEQVTVTLSPPAQTGEGRP